MVRLGVLTTVLLLFLAGCATAPPVVTDYDTTYSFGNLNTFRVEGTRQREGQNLLISPFTFVHLENVIADNLSARYQPAAEGDSPDFIVRYHLVIENRLDVRSYNQNYGFGYYGFGYGPFYRYPHSFHAPPSPRVYRQGSLIIDIVQAEDNRPLWRGVSERRLSDGLGPQEQRERLSAAATDILANFPPVSR